MPVAQHALAALSNPVMMNNNLKFAVRKNTNSLKFHVAMNVCGINLDSNGMQMNMVTEN